MTTTTPTPTPTSAASGTPVHGDDPHAAVWNMINGLFGFVALKAWVDLECSDHLRAEPLTAAALAERCGAEERFLTRLLRTMTSLGFAHEAGPGVYGLTEAGRVLSAEAAGSMRSGVLVAADQAAWDAMRQVSETIRSGRSPIEAEHGSWYDYNARNPDFGRTFQDFMTARSRTFARALAENVDLGDVRTIVDVGGGNGTFLATVLNACPDAHGTLMDLESVVPGARAFLAGAGLGDRSEAVPGDFFSAVPAGADLYILASVVHNWNDDDALRILRAVRDGMGDTSRALLVDILLPDDAEPHPGHLMDIRMMALFGSGRERARSEYVDLLHRAGLRAGRVRRLPGTPVSVIEAYRGSDDRD